MEYDFSSLDNKGDFVQAITAFYEAAPKDISVSLRCVLDLNSASIEAAYDRYIGYLDSARAMVSSRNPDQFKRAAALFLALYQSEPIKSINFPDCSNIEELGVDGFSPPGWHYADSITRKDFIQLYSLYHDELVAFDIAYRFCSVYAEVQRSYDHEYFQTFCSYVQINKDASLDDIFMIFKSLFQ